MIGSLLRSLEDILLRMYLYDASENVRFEYLFHFKKEQNPDYMVGYQDIGEQKNEKNFYSNNIKQPFVSGDKEVNALLMQLLKI